jgi:hypothetical protein
MLHLNVRVRRIDGSIQPYSSIENIGIFFRNMSLYLQICKVVLQRHSTHFPIHRCTRTRILSLHQLHPGNGFITASL